MPLRRGANTCQRCAPAVDKDARANELVDGAKAWLGPKLKAGEMLRLCHVRRAPSCWVCVCVLHTRHRLYFACADCQLGGHSLRCPP